MPVRLRLRKLYEAKNLTQAALALATGIRADRISQLANNEWQQITRAEMGALLSALDCTPADLFKGYPPCN